MWKGCKKLIQLKKKHFPDNDDESKKFTVLLIMNSVYKHWNLPKPLKMIKDFFQGQIDDRVDREVKRRKCNWGWKTLVCDNVSTNLLKIFCSSFCWVFLGPRSYCILSLRTVWRSWIGWTAAWSLPPSVSENCFSQLIQFVHMVKNCSKVTKYNSRPLISMNTKV